MQSRSGKAVGVNGIPPELWKDGGPVLHSKLHELLVCCRFQGKLPSDRCNTDIVTLYKNKGEKSDCSKYQGITLLFIAGKILASVLLNRLVPTITEDHLPETQCGFKANRGTTDMAFVLRHLQEKCREQNKGLYVVFVDLTKVFDTVSRKGLCMIIEWLGCPLPKFLSMVIQLHKDQHGQVRLNSDHSGSFLIINSMKQGCVLALTLFSIFFSMMLKQVIEDLDNDSAVYICYLLDGSLFNLRRLHAYTNTWAAVLWPPLHWQHSTHCPHQKSSAAPNFLPCRGYPALHTQSQLEENCTPGRILPSPRYHQWIWAESSSTIHLSGVYHHIRRQDRQRNRQQTSQGKQCFW